MLICLPQPPGLGGSQLSESIFASLDFGSASLALVFHITVLLRFDQPLFEVLTNKGGEYQQQNLAVLPHAPPFFSSSQDQEFIMVLLNLCLLCFDSLLFESLTDKEGEY